MTPVNTNTIFVRNSIIQGLVCVNSDKLRHLFVSNSDKLRHFLYQTQTNSDTFLYQTQTNTDTFLIQTQTNSDTFLHQTQTNSDTFLIQTQTNSNSFVSQGKGETLNGTKTGMPAAKVAALLQPSKSHGSSSSSISSGASSNSNTSSSGGKNCIPHNHQQNNYNNADKNHHLDSRTGTSANSGSSNRNGAVISTRTGTSLVLRASAKSQASGPLHVPNAGCTQSHLGDTATANRGNSDVALQAASGSALDCLGVYSDEETES
jgi:hypothetical protein